MPKQIRKASGIAIYGRRIKSLVFTTDLAIIKASYIPVFCGVGGGTTQGIRTVSLAKDAESQGAIGVVLNAPITNMNLLAVSRAVDIPVIITVTNAQTNILGRIEAGAFTKEEIVVWISKYKYGNINDLDYQKEIIDTFVNSVYVYDDKIVLTYNNKDGSQTLTLQEIESALSSHLTCLCPPRKRNPNS